MSLKESSNISRELINVPTKDGELEWSLKNLAKATERIFGIKCLCKIKVEKPVPGGSIAMHLYRIAQEAVNNAVKYSKSERIIIRLVQMDNRLALIIKDNGQGIKNGERRPGCMGLCIMRSRANLIGADFKIDSVNGKGVTVSCTVTPFNEQK